MKITLAKVFLLSIFGNKSTENEGLISTRECSMKFGG